MATVPGQLIWEMVKKNNSFLLKEFGNGTQSVQFSKEPNNLYNLNSYKHSGLANKKTVTIQPAGKDQSVLLATTKTKKHGKPVNLLHKSILKKEFYRMAKAVINQVADNYYRPDLKKAALARLSAVNRSLKVSGVKKKNRQASKIRGTILENPNLMRRRTCSTMRMAARPGDIFQFPSLSYKHTRSMQLVHIDTTIKN